MHYNLVGSELSCGHDVESTDYHGQKMGGGGGKMIEPSLKSVFVKKIRFLYYLMFLKRERELEMNKTAKETKNVYSNLYSFGGSINKKKFDCYIQRVSSMDG